MPSPFPSFCYLTNPNPNPSLTSNPLLCSLHSLFLTVLMFLHGKDRMEFRNPPSKFPRPANHDTENCGRWMMMKKDRSESDEGEHNAGLSLGLELGLGLNSSGSKSRGFTFLQIQELHHQSLIYKYIEAGLPVPLHLLVPIWKSFAAASINNGLHCPSFLGANPLMYLEYGKSLDPEPGRCRRTDGKKWRCSKEAVPNHKYCERHMHRGRQQRSRKLVEQAATAESARTSHINMDLAPHSNTNLSISPPSVSPSTFVFSAAKKNESSLCF